MTSDPDESSKPVEANDDAEDPSPPSGPQRAMLPRESASSLLIEMMFNPAGPKFESAEEMRLQGHGSAFLYRVDERLFLVTARHNLTGRHWQTKEALGGYSASPTNLRIAWLGNMPETGWKMTLNEEKEGMPPSASASIPMHTMAIPLVADDLKPIWLEHPQGGDFMDVAALELANLPDMILLVPWESDQAQQPDGIWPLLAPGQDVMVLGYPFKLASGPRLPLWTRGSISSHPGFGYEIDDEPRPLFLIDSRTRKGQSGSAVIRHRPAGTVFATPDGTPRWTINAMSELLGVYSGRTSEESDLGFVWVMEHVDVICRQGVPGTGTF